MKIWLLTVACFTIITSYAQNITKYYDAEWAEVPVAKAIYYAKFVKEGELYNCTTYYKDNDRLRGMASYPDTVMVNPAGMVVAYNKKGKLEDSAFYEDGSRQFYYHYFPNGQLSLHYYVPGNKKEGITEGYDEEGKRVKNYIFEREAEFKGGQSAWINYLIKNISKEIPVKRKGDLAVKVEVRFVVGEDGSVVAQKITQSSGYKSVDNDALRVIAESPKWTPAIQFNNPLKAVRIQPITYRLVDGTK